jgi:hypothetical protein
MTQEEKIIEDYLELANQAAENSVRFTRLMNLNPDVKEKLRYAEYAKVHMNLAIKNHLYARELFKNMWGHYPCKLSTGLEMIGI